VRFSLLVALIALPCFPDEPGTQKLRATTEWIHLSPDSPGLWIEGASPERDVVVDLRVPGDSGLLASRLTVAENGRFSTLLRPRALPHADYILSIRAGREAIELPLSWGTPAERSRYAEIEVAFHGRAFARLCELTHELHRTRQAHAEHRNPEGWLAWSEAWRERRAELERDLGEFRGSRAVLVRGAEHWQLVASLCFAKTLHALYAAELNYTEGELGGDRASEWSVALAEQIEAFEERRAPCGPEDIARWARELGHDSPPVRERAGRMLARAGTAARSALTAAAESADPEVAVRAQELLRDLAK
jgi:hypothetical protein